MKRIRIATLSMAAAFLLGGCGTILNLKSGDPDVYGGVKKDVAYIRPRRRTTAPPRHPVKAEPFSLELSRRKWG